MIAGPVTFSLAAEHGNFSLSIDGVNYTSADTLTAAFSVPPGLASPSDWLGITERGGAPPSVFWQYVCGGKTACSSPVPSGELQFSLGEGLRASGLYDLTLFSNNGYSVLAGPVPFSFSFTTDCPAATGPTSPVQHALPEEGSPLARVAFSSCYSPSAQTSSALWEHVRQSGSELWLWLGDNQVTKPPLCSVL